LTALWLTVSIILVILGVAGTIIPVLPGTPLIFGGALVYGFATGFQEVTKEFLLLMFVLTLISLVLDYLAAAWGTRRYGGSSQAVLGAILGGVVGLLTLGPIGLLVGPMLAVVMVELLQRRPLDVAVRAAFGTLIGVVGGIGMQLLIGLTMALLFVFRIT